MKKIKNNILKNIKTDIESIKFNKKPKKLRHDQLWKYKKAYCEVLEDITSNTSMYLELFEKYLNKSKLFEYFFERENDIFESLINRKLFKFLFKFFEFKFELIKEKIKKNCPDCIILDSIYQVKFSYLNKIFNHEDLNYTEVNKKILNFYDPGIPIIDIKYFEYYVFQREFRLSFISCFGSSKKASENFKKLFRNYNSHIIILNNQDSYLRFKESKYNRKVYTFDQLMDYTNLIYRRVSRLEKMVQRFNENSKLKFNFTLGVLKSHISREIKRYIKNRNLSIPNPKRFGLVFYTPNILYFYSNDYFYICRNYDIDTDQDNDVKNKYFDIRILPIEKFFGKKNSEKIMKIERITI